MTAMANDIFLLAAYLSGTTVHTCIAFAASRPTSK